MSVESVTRIQSWNDTHFLKAQNKWVKLWHQKIEPDQRIQKILKDYDLIDHMIMECFEDRIKKIMVATNLSTQNGWVQHEYKKEMAQWIYYFKNERQMSLAEVLPILNKASASIKA